MHGHSNIKTQLMFELNSMTCSFLTLVWPSSANSLWVFMMPSVFSSSSPRSSGLRALDSSRNCLRWPSPSSILKNTHKWATGLRQDLHNTPGKVGKGWLPDHFTGSPHPEGRKAWWWRQLVPPNCWHLSTVPAWVTYLNTAVLIPHAVFFTMPSPAQPSVVSWVH